jgi:ketosteroid isomerase-like protein
MRTGWVLAVTLVAGGGAWAAEPETRLKAEVRATETAFAKTMADRDLAAFGRFLAEETVFLSDKKALHGKAAVIEGWKRFFEGKEAPFSWQPADVEVVASGTLAITKGPVFDPKGARVGTFVSTWRLEKDGQWRIVLDTGCPDCECPASKP